MKDVICIFVTNILLDDFLYEVVVLCGIGST